MRWGNGEAALALTIKMGTGEGCGAWLGNGVKRAAEHVGKGSEEFAVHVHGGEPAYHDSRFTSLMGVTYIADPTPGRHTAGSARRGTRRSASASRCPRPPTRRTGT